MTNIIFNPKPLNPKPRSARLGLARKRSESSTLAARSNRSIECLGLRFRVSGFQGLVLRVSGFRVFG